MHVLYMYTYIYIYIYICIYIYIYIYIVGATHVNVRTLIIHGRHTKTDYRLCATLHSYSNVRGARVVQPRATDARLGAYAHGTRISSPHTLQR